MKEFYETIVLSQNLKMLIESDFLALVKKKSVTLIVFASFLLFPLSTLLASVQLASWGPQKQSYCCLFMSILEHFTRAEQGLVTEMIKSG